MENETNYLRANAVNLLSVEAVSALPLGHDTSKPIPKDFVPDHVGAMISYENNGDIHAIAMDVKNCRELMVGLLIAMEHHNDTVARNVIRYIMNGCKDYPIEPDPGPDPDPDPEYLDDEEYPGEGFGDE